MLPDIVLFQSYKKTVVNLNCAFPSMQQCDWLLSRVGCDQACNWLLGGKPGVSGIADFSILNASSGLSSLFNVSSLIQSLLDDFKFNFLKVFSVAKLEISI